MVTDAGTGHRRPRTGMAVVVVAVIGVALIGASVTAVAVIAASMGGLAGTGTPSDEGTGSGEDAASRADTSTSPPGSGTPGQDTTIPSDAPTDTDTRDEPDAARAGGPTDRSGAVGGAPSSEVGSNDVRAVRPPVSAGPPMLAGPPAPGSPSDEGIVGDGRPEPPLATDRPLDCVVLVSSTTEPDIERAMIRVQAAGWDRVVLHLTWPTGEQVLPVGLEEGLGAVMLAAPDGPPEVAVYPTSELRADRRGCTSD